ncbi:hypothetical protein [Caulobacter sp.]|uniref:hypothetical protein n=1 Tax=Caulobacter sp. TaxID=78 RepID=UPI002B4A1DA7|nr:hypothetical protein [Caulobacter sp.]HJV42777.1 hypothetical protein [Caulobacter sp.]
MTENHYYVRPVAGVWHVTWNDSAELIGCYSSQHEAEALAQLLARHMREQGRMAKVQVFEPEVRTPSWGRNRAASHAAA